MKGEEEKTFLKKKGQQKVSFSRQIVISLLFPYIDLNHEPFNLAISDFFFFFLVVVVVIKLLLLMMMMMVLFDQLLWLCYALNAHNIASLLV